MVKTAEYQKQFHIGLLQGGSTRRPRRTTREMPQTLNGRDELTYKQAKVSKTVMDNTISGIVQDHLAKIFAQLV